MTFGDASISEWAHESNVEVGTVVNTIEGDLDAIHIENNDKVKVTVVFIKADESAQQVLTYTGSDVTLAGGGWQVNVTNASVPGGGYIGGEWQIGVSINNVAEDSHRGTIIEEET